MSVSQRMGLLGSIRLPGEPADPHKGGVMHPQDDGFPVGAIAPAAEPARTMAYLASDVAQRAAAFRVRHSAYCDHGLMRCDLAPTDPHDVWDGDRNTRIFVVQYGDTIIGSARAINSNSAFGLQAQKFVELSGREADLELTRVALDHDWRPDDRKLREEVLLSLLGVVAQYQWRRDRYRWVQTMRAGMVLFLSACGVPFLPPVSTIEITDRKSDGVPLKDRHLFLGFLDLRDVALATFALRPDVYRLLFGTVVPMVPHDEERFELLKAQIAASQAVVASAR